MVQLVPLMGKQMDITGPLNIYEKSRANALGEQVTAQKMQMAQQQHDLSQQRTKQLMAQTSANMARSSEQDAIKKELGMVDVLFKFSDRADTPEKWRALTERMKKIYGPDSVQGFEDFSMRPNTLQMLGKHKTTLMKNLEAAGFQPGTEAYQQQMRQSIVKDNRPSSVKEAEYYNSLPEGDPRREYMKASASKSPEPFKPTKKSTNDLQKRIIDSQSMLTRLDKVRNSYNEDYLTVTGKLYGMGVNIADRLPTRDFLNDKDFIRGRTKFDNEVEQIFNQYRKEITGAAAAIQELERLKQSLLNKDMTPTQFEASYEQFRSTIEDSMKISQTMLQRGIDPRTKEGGKVFDQIFTEHQASKSEAQLTPEQQTIVEQAKEALQAGRNRQQVIELMRKMGVDPKELDK